MKRAGFLKARIALLFACALLLSAFTATGSASYLSETSNTVPNVFAPGTVNIGVVESKNGDVTSGIDIPMNEKTAEKNVWIKNLFTPGVSSAPAFIRVRLVTIWRDSSGDGTGVPADVTYTMARDDPGTGGKWVARTQDGETTYYFTAPVDPGALTDQLIKGVTVNGDLPAGQTLEIQVLADAVQSDGGAAQDAWGIDPGSLTG